MSDGLALFLLIVIPSLIFTVLVIKGRNSEYPRVMKWEKHKQGDYTATVQWSRKTNVSFRGNGSEWRMIPSGNRCNDVTSSWLADRLSVYKWNE